MAIGIAFLLAAGLLGLRELRAQESVNRVSYVPLETRGVLDNPYTGFVADAKDAEIKLPARLAHANMTWRQLEPEKGKYAWDAIEQSIHLDVWKQRNTKIILRVVLDVPGEDSHKDIPDWLYEETGRSGEAYDTPLGQGFSPDYANPVLIANHERLIRALGERYNHDPAIAAVQLGSIGHWGEWHTWNEEEGRLPYPVHEITDQYAEHYLRYFDNKTLLMRRPHEIARGSGMGLFNDAFGKADSTVGGFLRWYTEGYTSWLTGEQEPAMPDFWVKAPSAGEFAQDAKYLDDAHIEATLKQAQLTHVSWMGPSVPLTLAKGSSLPANAQRFLTTIGYRFVITQESHEAKVQAGSPLHVSLNLNNRGAAPFYYPWPLELSLVDAGGRVITAQKGTADIREWLPGDTAVSETLNVPAGTAPGVYTVHVAILDPDTVQPGIRFAVDGARADLRYPLGRVTVK
ncbi:DUF4832 domain-containing protein [Paenibacillus caseinilyticus]|nr:DUF4832 domain-containing protein [Paenibacillus caseinilyticus]MCZ8518250.1 DUF4832 domain-containing protein [Paenibacillus caseinilyticus]